MSLHRRRHDRAQPPSGSSFRPDPKAEGGCLWGRRSEFPPACCTLVHPGWRV